MIAYSDLVIEENSPPLINLEIKKTMLLDADLTIYQQDRLICSQKIKTLNHTIKLDPFEANYVELTMLVCKKNRQIKLPYSILSLKKDEPYIICDIDFTVSATNILLYLTNNLLKLKTLNNSAEILAQLAQNYKIIYLTGRIDLYTKLTKLWLKKNNFPDGPLIARRYESSFQLEAFKYNALKSIVAISKNGIGIGDLKSDISAYKMHQLTAIRIKRYPFFNHKNDYYDYNHGYFEVNSWKGIEKIFNNYFLNHN